MRQHVAVSDQGLTPRLLTLKAQIQFQLNACGNFGAQASIGGDNFQSI